MVNVRLKGVTEITSGEDERDECKRTAEDASKSNRDDTKTGIAFGIARLVREERDRNLLTGHAVSGVQAA